MLKLRTGMRRIALALQGGGSHGAFTWGVLDRLLEDPLIEPTALSGASAGAVNAVVLAHGWTKGGRDGARAALTEFWERLGRLSLPGFGALAAAGKPLLLLTRFFSPYQLNPLDLNPLRRLLEEQVDFERLRTHCPLPLFVAATRVATGTLRVFRTRELTVDTVLASACLPTLHHAIEIDGEAYWDGGFAANAPLYSLVIHAAAPDLIIIALHPKRRAKTPLAADEIAQRASEISFSSAFFTEVQGILLAQRQARRMWVPLSQAVRRLRHLRLHLVDGGAWMEQLPGTSRMNIEAEFLRQLHAHGRERAGAWLERNRGVGAPTARSLEELLFSERAREPG